MPNYKKAKLKKKKAKQNQTRKKKTPTPNHMGKTTKKLKQWKELILKIHSN